MKVPLTTEKYPSVRFDIALSENMLHRMHAGTGRPTVEGIYAAEVYFGWKLLEWKDGAWWHLALVGRWTATKPVQWVGPLPQLTRQESKQEYDL